MMTTFAKMPTATDSTISPPTVDPITMPAMAPSERLPPPPPGAAGASTNQSFQEVNCFSGPVLLPISY